MIYVYQISIIYEDENGNEMLEPVAALAYGIEELKRMCEALKAEGVTEWQMTWRLVDKIEGIE